MSRYVALLRGVSPLNAKMPALRAAFESAGFTEVKTVRSSGNVLFSARAASARALERRAETAMEKQLGRGFLTIVRPVEALRAIMAADPYKAFRLAPGSKRVVTFLRDEPRARLKLPIEVAGARILCMQAREVFTAYLPSARGAVFMTLIEKTFGQAVTTRTWDTVGKLASGGDR
jgi:uncharacterized protein (DUF1697 family)